MTRHDYYVNRAAVVSRPNKSQSTGVCCFTWRQRTSKLQSRTNFTDRLGRWNCPDWRSAQALKVHTHLTHEEAIMNRAKVKKPPTHYLLVGSAVVGEGSLDRDVAACRSTGRAQTEIIATREAARYEVGYLLSTNGTAFGRSLRLTRNTKVVIDRNTWYMHCNGWRSSLVRPQVPHRSGTPALAVPIERAAVRV